MRAANLDQTGVVEHGIVIAFLAGKSEPLMCHGTHEWYQMQCSKRKDPSL